MRFSQVIVIIMIAGGLLCGAAHAAVTSTAGSGERAASATFQVVDDHLIVKLSNLSSLDAQSKQDVLTGFYFDAAQGVSLQAKGAVLGDGRLVGGEWGYAQGDKVAKRTSGARHGVGAANLRIFNSKSLFPGTNIGGGKAPGNHDFGLTSAIDDLGTGQGTVFKDSIFLVFSGEGLTEQAFSNVRFQYGTNTKRDPVLVGGTLVNDPIASFADVLNRLPGADGGETDEGGSPVANPAPPALAGGLALMGMLAARRRRAGATV